MPPFKYLIKEENNQVFLKYFCIVQWNQELNKQQYTVVYFSSM